MTEAGKDEPSLTERRESFKKAHAANHIVRSLRYAFKAAAADLKLSAVTEAQTTAVVAVESPPPPPQEPAKPPPKWQALSQGFALASKMTAYAAKPTQDLAATLDNAIDKVLTSYFDGVKEHVATTQREVIAANVPIASYGRVKDALDKLKEALGTQARELLTTEFGFIRTSAVESLRAQKVCTGGGFTPSSPPILPSVLTLSIPTLARPSLRQGSTSRLRRPSTASGKIARRG